MLKPQRISHQQQDIFKSARPSWGESYGAGLATYIVPMTDHGLEKAMFGGADYDQDFDFASAILARPELDKFAVHLAHAKNNDHFDFLVSSLQRNQARRDILSRTHWAVGLTTELLNPVNWLFAYPALGAVSAALTGAGRISAAGAAGVRQGLAAGASMEAIRYPFDPLESASEAALNVAAAGAFGGGLGAGIPAGYMFAKSVLPETTRRLLPSINKTMREEERWQGPGEVRDIDGVQIVETDDFSAPTVASRKRKETIQLDEDTVVFYAPSGQPVRAAVVRDEDGMIETFDIGDGVSREVGDPEYSTVSPYETDKVLSPLVTDDGVNPVIADLDDVELDEAITFAESEFQTATGDRLFEIERQLTALQARRKKLKAPDDPPRRVEEREVDEIVINLDSAKDDFETGKYTFPEVEGSTSLAPNDFRSFDDYRDFLAYKEHLKTTEPKKKKESAAVYEDRINSLSLGRLADGYSTKKTFFNAHYWFKSPAFRVLSNPKTPQAVKRIMSLMTGNNQVALDRNTAGFGVNAVDQQMVRGTVMFRQTLDKLQDLWVRETKARDEAIRSRALGFNAEEFLPNKKSFKEWFESEADNYLSDSPMLDTKGQQEFHSIVKGLLDDFLVMAQDDGLLLGITRYEVEIKRIRDEMEFKTTLLNRQESGSVKYNILKKELEELEFGVDGLRAMEDAMQSARGSSSYKWPRYFDIVALRKSYNGDKVYYNELRDILIDEYSINPIREAYNPKTGKMESYVSDPVKDAGDTLNKIMQDQNDPQAYVGTGMKGKHLQRRVLNVPDSKLKKFLVKDVTVLASYADKMGFRMAWNRNFGGKTLNQVMKDIEDVANADPAFKALSKKEQGNIIAQAQKAFYGDYLRATGTHITNPHRWDNQIAKVLSDYTGIVYLAGSGITAVGDTVNMIAARSFADMLEAVRHDLPALIQNVKDMEGFVEVLSMSPNMIKEQMMADAKTGLQPTLADRMTHLPSRVMFNLPVIGNDLHAVTSITRRIAAAYNISDIIDIAFKIADPDKKISSVDLQRAGQLGIDEDVAAYIFSQRDVIGKGKKIWLANSKDWELENPKQRRAYETFLQAIDLATDAQIIMAKSFDKPLIVDGVTFVRYHPIMGAVFGMKPDPVISRNGRQYAKVQSGILKFPFQFFNYSFGASSSVLGRQFDPNQERRLQQVALSVAMGAAIIYAKPNGEYFFENNDNTTIALRSLERSGIMSIYGDIFYEAIHMATATGAVDPDDMLVRGKFATKGRDVFAPIGPAPNLAADLSIAMNDFLDNKTTANARELSRALPRIVTPFVTLDFATLYKAKDNFD